MWDGVPYAIGGGEAEHSSETGRLLGYVGFRGQEGIVSPPDLQVRELATPGPAVRALRGACSILNRSTGSFADAYAARNPDEDVVPVTATGSSSRSDLVIARVENPFDTGEDWPLPSDPAQGPYVFTRVIENVDPATTDIHDIRPGDSAINLARLDIPPNTTNMAEATVDFVDLRKMSGVLTHYFQESIQHQGAMHGLGSQSDVFVDFPNSAVTHVDVPEWATRMDLNMTIITARLDAFGSGPANEFGRVRVLVAGEPGGGFSRWNGEWPGDTASRLVIGHAATYNVVPHRGQRIELRSQASTLTGNGNVIQADDGTATTFSVYFRAQPVFNF